MKLFKFQRLCQMARFFWQSLLQYNIQICNKVLIIFLFSLPSSKYIVYLLIAEFFAKVFKQKSKGF
jgi:hypothetical protein